MDPAIGRFITIDPMADFMNYQSPYVMAGNNPVANIDFYGLGGKPPGSFVGSLLRSIRNLFQKSNKRAAPGVKNRRNRSRGTGLVINKKETTEQDENNTTNESCASCGVKLSMVEPDFGQVNIVSLPAQKIPQIKIPNIRIPNPFVLKPGKLIRFEKDILFIDGTTNLSRPNVARKTLNNLIKTLKDYPHLKVFIEGNTAGRKDATPGEKHMFKKEAAFPLQKGRAAAVRDFLIENGITPGRLHSRKGKHRFVGPSGKKTTFTIINPK